MQSWVIDPKTGDYVLKNGVPVETNSLLIPAYIRLKTQRKNWLYAPDETYGSDYYLIKKRPSTASNNVIESIGQRALQPVVDDGRASEITIETTGNTRDATALKTQITDAQGVGEETIFKGL